MVKCFPKYREHVVVLKRRKSITQWRGATSQNFLNNTRVGRFAPMLENFRSHVTCELLAPPYYCTHYALCSYSVCLHYQYLMHHLSYTKWRCFSNKYSDAIPWKWRRRAPKRAWVFGSQNSWTWCMKGGALTAGLMTTKQVIGFIFALPGSPYM